MDGYAFDDNAIRNGLGKLTYFELMDKVPVLTRSEMKVVELLEDVSEIIDSVYAEQICPAMLDVVRKLGENSSGANSERLKYVLFNKSPWDIFNGLKPFITGNGICKGVAVYPEGIAKEELESAMAKGEIDPSAAKSYYTAIERHGNRLVAVAYADKYRKLLEKAAAKLNEAANAADNKSLSAYLKATANAFLSNDYDEQQKLWLKLDSRIEPTIGPYETYDDRKFGYKGFFESYVSIRNDEETRRLKVFSSKLEEIDMSIPIEAGLDFRRKSQANSPIVVVEEIYSGGMANAGFTTSAFNLPNDEAIRRTHGSKKVLMKNVIDAKFDALHMPVAERLLDKKQLSLMDKEAQFLFILFHELSHGLGASEARIRSEYVPASIALKELFLHIEEARADITGIFCAMHFAKQGMLGSISMESFYVSYLAADLLRGMRMGLKEAHAMGEAIEYNYLKENGGIFYNPKEKRFGIDMDKIEAAIIKLVRELNSVEASGDYGRAERLTEKYCRYTAELEEAYNSIGGLPVDAVPKQHRLQGPA